MKTFFGSMYEISSYMKTFFGSMYEISSCYDRGFLIDEIMLYLIMYELFHDPYFKVGAIAGGGSGGEEVEEIFYLQLAQLLALTLLLTLLWVRLLTIFEDF